MTSDELRERIADIVAAPDTAFFVSLDRDDWHEFDIRELAKMAADALIAAGLVTPCASPKGLRALDEDLRALSERNLRLRSEEQT